MILSGGRLLGRREDSLAIGGDRIVAIGGAGEISALASGRTETIDIAGQLVIPAFGDAHVHAVGAGLESLRCDLTPYKTRHEYLQAISRYAAALPPDAWVLGGGWSLEGFPGGKPEAADLEAAAGGRPVFLPNRDHHGAWVSPAAVGRAGVDRDTPDPADGRVERGAGGEPSGLLHEGAMRLVGDLVPPTGAAELAAALQVAQQRLHSLGITYWQDAIVGRAVEIGVEDSFEAYRRAAEDGTLTADVVGALWWDRNRGLEQIDDLLARRELAGAGRGRGRFRATTVKVMVDGICETLTAAMSRPYDTGDHTHRGEPFIEPELLDAAVRILDEHGFQVHFHAIGDRAVTLALDAVAGLPPASRSANRHHIAHLQFVHPDDLRRLGSLGVTSTFQPIWAVLDPQMEEHTLPLIGADRAGWQYRIGTVASLGGRLAFGSDWPVSSPDPIQGIHAAVNRSLSTRVGRAGTSECDETFLPEEAVSLSTALAAATSGVAWVNHCEAERGQLEVGMRADLAVLDRDILAGSPQEIGEASVVMTVAGGRVVFGQE